MVAQIISFNCVLRNRAGRLISSTYNREVLTSLDIQSKEMLSGLNSKLQDLKKGEKRTITVLAEEAYGLYDPQKVILFPRKKLPSLVSKGEMLTIAGKSGVQKCYRVLDIHGDFISLDGNHPLAGQDLIFEIETFEVRDATRQEIDASINTVASQLLH
jgi:FKBP-type peptidyl-prolyl cis-trans isomerase SlyD